MNLSLELLILQGKLVDGNLKTENLLLQLPVLRIQLILRSLVGVILASLSLPSLVKVVECLLVVLMDLTYVVHLYGLHFCLIALLGAKVCHPRRDRRSRERYKARDNDFHHIRTTF